MDIAKSNVVKSCAGRDSGKYFFVLAVEGEFLLLADGRTRKVETPKRKKRRHAQFVAAEDSRVAEKLRNSEKVTNSELRKALAAYGREKGNQNQEG